MSGRRQIDLCGLGKQQTLTDTKYWSVNKAAAPGSPEDIYKHNPWRAPGTAPIGDACGFAGGTPWAPEVGEAGDYQKTRYAHHGMRGTALPPMDTGVEWTLGTTAEVTWQVSNNHGGGYSYRLCPFENNLTETCFQAHPLEFVETEQRIVTRDGVLHPVANPVFVSGADLVHPASSHWSMIPIPSTILGPLCLPGPNDTDATPFHCLPNETAVGSKPSYPCGPCPGTPGSDCSRCDNTQVPSFPPPMSGATGNSHSHGIRDVLKVPSDLPAGKYVLGFRYDCEATAQVWSSCSDITLVR